MWRKQAPTTESFGSDHGESREEDDIPPRIRIAQKMSERSNWKHRPRYPSLASSTPFPQPSQSKAGPRSDRPTQEVPHGSRFETPTLAWRAGAPMRGMRFRPEPGYTMWVESGGFKLICQSAVDPRSGSSTGFLNQEIGCLSVGSRQTGLALRQESGDGASFLYIPKTPS